MGSLLLTVVATGARWLLQDDARYSNGAQQADSRPGHEVLPRVRECNRAAGLGGVQRVHANRGTVSNEGVGLLRAPR
jgi:hypothetical protein